jgi:hypothetical protein
MQAGLRWHTSGACKSDAALVVSQAMELAQTLNQGLDVRFEVAARAEGVGRSGEACQGMCDRPDAAR